MKSLGSPYSVAEENNEADSAAILILSHLMSKIQQKKSLGFKIFLFAHFGLQSYTMEPYL